MIHKIVLHAPNGVRSERMFSAGRPLSVGWQGRDLCIWYETGERLFEAFVVPTGASPPVGAEYVGTAQTTAFADEGYPFMVFHVYALSDDRRG